MLINLKQLNKFKIKIRIFINIFLKILNKNKLYRKLKKFKIIKMMINKTIVNHKSKENNKLI